MPQDTDTNFGYWSDRPPRIERPSQFAAANSRMAGLETRKTRKTRSIWKEVVLIVAIFLTLAIVIVRLV
jgi:hypothetical protein